MKPAADASSQPRFFASAADFRAWLQAHAATAPEIIVGYWKVGTGRSSMTWSESVDEALCFGWIDGVRRRIDEASYQIRFTPRRRDSIWSAVNVAKMQALIASGRMRPEGLTAYAARRDARTAVYSYEAAPASRKQAAAPEPELTASEQRYFRKHREAWDFFQSCPPSHHKRTLQWVVSAKQPETRQRRLDKLIAACARKER